MLDVERAPAHVGVQTSSQPDGVGTVEKRRPAATPRGRYSTENVWRTWYVGKKLEGGTYPRRKWCWRSIVRRTVLSVLGRIQKWRQAQRRGKARSSVPVEGSVPLESESHPSGWKMSTNGVLETHQCHVWFKERKRKFRIHIDAYFVKQILHTLAIKTLCHTQGKGY